MRTRIACLAAFLAGCLVQDASARVVGESTIGGWTLQYTLETFSDGTRQKGCIISSPTVAGYRINVDFGQMVPPNPKIILSTINVINASWTLKEGAEFLGVIDIAGSMRALKFYYVDATRLTVFTPEDEASNQWVAGVLAPGPTTFRLPGGLNFTIPKPDATVVGAVSECLAPLYQPN